VSYEVDVKKIADSIAKVASDAPDRKIELASTRALLGIAERLEKVAVNLEGVRNELGALGSKIQAGLENR
jgi:hypothetical protein